MRWVLAGVLHALSAEERASRRGASIPLLSGHGPLHRNGLGFLAMMYWGNGSKLVHVVISFCVWEMLVVPSADILCAVGCVWRGGMVMA